MNENSVLNDDNNDKIFLLLYMIIEIIFKFEGKIYDDLNNVSVDLNCSLLQFKAIIMNIILNYHEKMNLDIIKYFWKWEKYVMI